MTQEVLPGGYWLRPVLFDEFIPSARPGTLRAWSEVPANQPPELPLAAPGEVPPPAPPEEPSRTPQEVPPRPYAGGRTLLA